MNSTLKRIEACGLVVVFNDAANAVKTAEALLAGGVDVMEITLRTDALMRLSWSKVPDILVGAGTVLTMAQCKRPSSVELNLSYRRSIRTWPYCLDQNVLPCPGRNTD